MAHGTALTEKGTPHSIQPPLEQAKKNMYALIAKLQEIPRFRNHQFTLGYAAILPDVQSPHRNLGIDAPLQLFAFAPEMDNSKLFINRFASYWKYLWNPDSGRMPSNPALNEKDIEAIITALAPSVELKRSPMAIDLKEYSKEIISLTKEQYHLLQFLSRTRRALISGGAGTGKTMLAFEKARRLARQGYQTLFTCPNRLLADYLSFQVQEEDLNDLLVMNFHQFCYQMGKKAGIGDLVDPDGPIQIKLAQSYFEEKLPDALLQALDMIPTRFDAIIVDEGQDMKSDWWELLELCLRDPKRGVFYIFYDQNQNIWYTDAKLPFDLEPFILVENLRNNRNIHQMLRRFFDGHDYQAGGPEGGEITYIEIDSYDNGIIEKELEKLLHQLIKKEKIKPCDIAILTGTSKQKSKLAGIDKIANYPLVDQCPGQEGQVFFSSIRRFRGMEKPVVILIELEDTIDPESLSEAYSEQLSCSPNELPIIAKETLYIGLSRAQSFLYIIDQPRILRKSKKNPSIKTDPLRK